MYSLLQKLFAEFLGTFALIFVAAGSICADQYFRAAGQPSLGPLGVALAYGLAAAAMVHSLGHISGGHFNPAVTIGLWVTKRLDTLQALFYSAAQLLGSGAAAYLLAAIFPESIWRPVGLGTPDLMLDFTRMRGMMIESILTFLLVLVFFACVVDKEGGWNGMGALAVGLTLTVDALVGQPFTGASMNPARSFGPALVAHHWTNHGVYWVGPLFGGIFASVIYDQLFLRDQPAT